MSKLWFALHAFRFAKEKGLTNKRALIALVAASVLVLIVWAGFVLLGYLWRQAPAVIEGGRELAALGFEGTVLAATAREEIREYRKAKQRLRVEIRRHERPGKDAVEVVIAET